MASFKLVTDQNIGSGLKIAATKLQADLGAGLMFSGNQIAADPATLPITVTLANPSGTNLQANINGNLSNILDLTPAIQAGETTTTLTYDPPTKTLTYTNEDGTVATIDLSALALDIHVSGGAYDPATMVLTLTDNDATTPDITLNLADLKKVVTQASNAITFTGTGEATSPLQANLNLDPLTGNLLQVTASGIKVDPADVNALIAAALTVDVQDLAGTHLFYALP